MTKRILVAAGLIAALVGGSTAIFAQGPGPRQGFAQRGPRMGALRDLGLRGVDLTDAQREQMRSIMQSHRAEFESVNKALREAFRAFAEATRAATVDDATIRARSTDVANAMAEEAILRAKVRAEIHGLLTAEQQQQLKDRQAAMQKRMEERKQRLQQRLQQRKQQRQQRPPQ